MTRSDFKSSRRWFPMTILVIGLILTGFATYYAWRAVKLENQTQFEAEARQAQAVVQTRMESYLALLRGGAAFFAGTPRAKRGDFKQYVDRLRIEKFYPGIQAFAFTIVVDEQSKPQLEALMREQGLANFRIWPDNPREEYHSIVFIEPFDKRNAHAVGFDMYTEPVRRAAMSQARDTGLAVASGKVTLVQEIEGKKQAGFLIYVPVYVTGQVPDSIEQRRKDLRGFIYSAFRADDLFLSLFANEQGFSMKREIFDGPNTVPEALLHNSHPETRLEPVKLGAHTLAMSMPFEFAGHVWTLRITALQGFRSRTWVPLGVLIGGAMIFTVLFFVTRAQVHSQIVTEETAARLLVSERSLRDAREALEVYARELEQRVEERTARLKESVQALEGVLYHVAHDLRAPLRAMASFTNILAQEYPERLDNRGIDYLNRISQAAQRMDELVKDLLAYGRLTHMAVPITDVPLEQEVDSVVTGLGEKIQCRDARVDIERPLPAVRANPGVLRDVITHLLENALKFVPDGRKPEIKIRAETGTHVRLWVEDNGIGIGSEYRERIFRVFERLHGQNAYSGTGIGLAIVRKGLERMGGNVGVESELGRGSRFWVELAASGKQPV